MWVRFQPFAKKIPELIAEGVIGEPRLVIVNKEKLTILALLMLTRDLAEVLCLAMEYTL